MGIYIEFQSLDDVGAIINCIKSHDVQIYEVDIDRGRKENMRNPNAVFSIRLNQKQPHSALMASLSSLDHVLMIDEI